MPLIPAPPIPTKCTRFTLCFIAGVPSAMQASATRSAASGRATLRAAIAIASSDSRVYAAIRAASASGVSSDCGTIVAAPASTRNRAFALCSSAIAPGSGTMIAPTPTAASSATVVAPPRQTTRSASA